MITFLAIQNTYQVFEIALLNDEKVIDVHSEDKHNTSKSLIIALDTLLHRNNVDFEKISFIAVNQGPGPFSTLRSVLACVNGLYCATQIPLIGIDGLDATLSEYRSATNRTVVLLNAFNSDIYYAIERHNDTPLKGYENINTFLHGLKQNYPSENIFFIGNATQLYSENIKQVFGNCAIIPDVVPDMNSVKQIGILGLKKWERNDFITTPLLPAHLKKHQVELI